MSRKDKLKSGVKALSVELFIEFYKDEIIETLRSFLAPLTPEGLRQLVDQGEAPPIPDKFLAALRGYEDYLGKLKPERFFEFMNEARPDLAEALIALGDQGAEYIVKIKAFLIDSVRAHQLPTQPPKEDQEPPQDLLKLTCDNCGESWTATREEADKTKECPSCGADREK